MATATKTAARKTTASKQTTEVAEPTPDPAPKGKSYRDHPDFTPALKAAKSLAKGNTDLTQPLQLITHLAWKTSGGSVGWAKGTTASVIAYADDLAVPVGTVISEAMTAALAAATKATSDKPQKDAVAVLAKVIAAAA